MDNNLNEVVLDKLTKTCRCRAISRAKIKEAIKNGASTFEEVKEITGAGKGSCK
ncbi:MAG: (2Fe-2S)-binding protein, partial [Clostridium butyricum]|nr:(2Fe-2S)-binding protein [Clostridium butyricum]